MLSDRKGELESEKKELERAKRHLAWKKDAEIQELQNTLDRVDETTLRSCRSSIQIYKKSLEDVEDKTRRMEELQDRLTPFEWLRKAEVQYRSLMENCVCTSDTAISSRLLT